MPKMSRKEKWSKLKQMFGGNSPEQDEIDQAEDDAQAAKDARNARSKARTAARRARMANEAPKKMPTDRIGGILSSFRNRKK